MEFLDNDKIEQILSNVKTTMGVEGLQMTKQAEQLGRMVLKDDLTGDKAIEIIKDRYKGNITYDPLEEEIKAGDFERKEKYICE